MSGLLAGRVAVVTGAGSGIGRACALRFAAEGARLVVNDIDERTAAATADAIVGAGAEAIAVAGDVAQIEAVREAVDVATRTWGRIDVMHNNAGYGVPDSVADLSDDTLLEMVGVNLLGALHGTRAVLPHMIQQGGGSIINTASVAAFAASRQRTSYGIAKAGVLQLTRSTAVENGRYGIRANAICPGPIRTPAFERFAPDLEYYAAQIPMKRLGTPEDIAGVALFLASHLSAFVSGVALPVDGAATARLTAPHLSPDDVTR
ncbi:MAG TPA: SDR family oxidoreductase [Frankiaceae bacterium]|nr:SDR family oxidoreductase [Frankiaceae bacterium]